MAGEWEDWGRWTWNIRLRNQLVITEVKLGASGSYSGEQFEGITENRLSG